MISTERHNSWQQNLLIGMMLINLLVLSALIWRIYSNQSQQQTTVNSVLKDYAAMAGQKFISAIKRQIGYVSMFQLTQLWATSDDPTETIIDFLNTPDNEAEPNISTVKAALTNIQVIQIEQQKPQAVSHPQLTADSRAIPDLKDVNNYGVKAIHDKTADDLSYASLLLLNPKYAVLSSFSDDFVRQALDKIYQEQTLLPSILTPTDNNQGLTFMMYDQNQALLWQSNQEAEAGIQHVITIDDYYGSLFEGYQMTASIDQSLASALIIGGLPENQMPQLLLMIGLALIAMFTMLWIHRKANFLNQQKEQFIARASHELKTPLTQIRLFAETLELGRAESPSAQHHYLKIIHQESIRLSQLVDNILYQQQIQKSHLNSQTEQLKLKSFISDLIAEQQILWSQKSIEVSIHDADDTMVTTDPNLLKQILINVLDNAVKFGPEQQTILINISKLVDFISIKITDQGPGIPQDQINTLLQSYQRLSRDEHRGINGNGLGLSIANHLLHDLGGRLAFEHPKTGLTVELQLPINTVLHTGTSS